LDDIEGKTLSLSGGRFIIQLDQLPFRAIHCIIPTAMTAVVVVSSRRLRGKTHLLGWNEWQPTQADNFGRRKVI
jgi:hypothetical protein